MSSLTSLFQNMADSIREVSGKTDKIIAEDFPQYIRNNLTGLKNKTGPLDPLLTYKETRPLDWLVMPTPQNNEIYILFHVLEGYYGSIAFNVYSEGGYTVEFSNAYDDQGNPTEYGNKKSFSTGAICSLELNYSELSESTLTSTGMRQVMIKITGNSITSFLVSPHSTKAENYSYNMVDFVIKAESANKVDVKNVYSLKYFSWIGTNQLTNCSNMFDNCTGLVSVLELDTSKVTDMQYMFHTCFSLMAFPPLDTHLVRNMTYMFRSCAAIQHIPMMDTSSCTNMSFMFYYCYALADIPPLNTSNVVDMNNMFFGCYSLVTIPELDVSKVTNMYRTFFAPTALSIIPKLKGLKATNMDQAFTNLYSLIKIELDPTVVGWTGYDITFANSSLGHTALVGLFNSLPSITTIKNLTITNNPGVSALTSEEKAIATNKKWNLVI